MTAQRLPVAHEQELFSIGHHVVLAVAQGEVSIRIEETLDAGHRKSAPERQWSSRQKPIAAKKQFVAFPGPRRFTSTVGIAHGECDAEISHERLPFLPQHVLGFEVAMNHALPMRIVERIGH